MTDNTDPVRALLAPKLDMIISGYRINQDDADWLRGLLHRASAPPSAPVGDEAAATLAFEEHINGSADDPYFEGELELWLAAWRAALAQQPAAPSGEAGGDWVTVPRIPTDAMLDAMHGRIRILCNPAERTADIQNDVEVWGAMLAAAPQQPAAVAAIQFALTDPEGMTFLRLWNVGEFDTLRREWPDAPSEVYVGADPLAAQQPVTGEQSMNKINDGGPAFPVWELNGNGQQEMTGFGMTLRDYFAARMMVCELAREIRPHESYNYLNAATRAYRMADAMLKAREASNG